MSDIPRQAVEAAARALCNYDGVDPDRPCVIAQPYEDWYDTRYRAHDGPAWKAWEYEAEASLAAALPHLASAQPHPSDSEAATKAIINVPREEVIASLRAQLREKIAALAKARAAAIAECEAIARTFTYSGHLESMRTAHSITNQIAALKRGPVAEESGE